MLFTATLPPTVSDSRVTWLPDWWPKWLDLNVLVPVIATIVVIIVGIVVICVAVTRRKNGIENLRLRGEAEAIPQPEIKDIQEEFVCFFFSPIKYMAVLEKIIVGLDFIKAGKKINTLSSYNFEEKEIIRIIVLIISLTFFDLYSPVYFFRILSYKTLNNHIHKALNYQFQLSDYLNCMMVNIRFLNCDFCFQSFHFLIQKIIR